jgi:hypothetical protein
MLPLVAQAGFGAAAQFGGIVGDGRLSVHR